MLERLDILSEMLFDIFFIGLICISPSPPPYTEYSTMPLELRLGWFLDFEPWLVFLFFARDFVGVENDFKVLGLKSRVSKFEVKLPPPPKLIAEIRSAKSSSSMSLSAGTPSSS